MGSKPKHDAEIRRDIVRRVRNGQTSKPRISQHAIARELGVSQGFVSAVWREYEQAQSEAHAKGLKTVEDHTDFAVHNGGTICLLRPLSERAKEWVGKHIPDDAQWLGGAVAVEHRYIEPILEGILDDGLGFTGCAA